MCAPLFPLMKEHLLNSSPYPNWLFIRDGLYFIMHYDINSYCIELSTVWHVRSALLHLGHVTNIVKGNF